MPWFFSLQQPTDKIAVHICKFEDVDLSFTPKLTSMLLGQLIMGVQFVFVPVASAGLLHLQLTSAQQSMPMLRRCHFQVWLKVKPFQGSFAVCSECAAYSGCKRVLASSSGKSMSQNSQAMKPSGGEKSRAVHKRP